mmetsp:Transcript_21557/g.32315  ORF Transcript_21557/g.32315 Transcript_21557/m.32315 type:complete len:140 (-) Transcript_21557:69-488(-)
MTKSILTSAFLAIALLEGSYAFAPQTTPVRSATALNAESGRRELLGDLAKVLGAGALAVGGSQIPGSPGPELLAGLENPALGSFRGKYKGQSFTPGKGLRNNEELVAGLENPALGSFRGKYKGQSFTPGKGLRKNEEVV